MVQRTKFIKMMNVGKNVGKMSERCRKARRFPQSQFGVPHTEQVWYQSEPWQIFRPNQEERKKEELNEQREQSQTSLNSAESREKKSEAQ